MSSSQRTAGATGRVRRLRRVTATTIAAAVAGLALVAVPAAPPATAGFDDVTPPPERVAFPAVPEDVVQDLYVQRGPAGNPSIATCRDGDHVLNGGWETDRGEVDLRASWPTLDARGWEVSTFANGNAIAYAICARLRQGLSTYVVEMRAPDEYVEQEGDDGEAYYELKPSTSVAHCPSADRVLSGGGSTGAHGSLSESRPAIAADAADGPAVGWRVTASMSTARALCTAAGASFGELRSAKMRTNTLGGQSMLRVQCPSGTAVVGGGFRGYHEYVLRNHPISPAGWFTEQSYAQISGESVALCVSLGGAFSAAAVVGPARVPAGGGEARATCPAGYKVFGGGVSVDPHSTSLDAGSWRSSPGEDGASWVLRANYTGESHAACVRLAKATGTSVTAETVPTYEGELMTLAARVAARSGRPAGRVTFRVGGATVGSATINPDGVARINVGSPAAGTHTIVAEYAGDAIHGASSASSPMEVRPRRALTELTLRSSSDPSPRDVAVTLTASLRVSPTGTTPTGDVVFEDESGVIGAAPISGSGTASLTHTFTEPGLRILRATYAGDDRHQGSAGRLRLQVGTLLQVDELTVEESEASTTTGDIRVHLSAPLPYDVPVRLSVSGPGHLFAGGAAPTLDAVVPAGSATATVPLSVVAQLEQGLHQIAIGVSTQAPDVIVMRSAVPGFVHVSHPTCTAADTGGTGRLRGTDGHDVLCGLDGSDDVSGLGGDDVVYGGDGDDQVVGGPGDDRVSGGPGSDRLVAGGGTDRLVATDGVSGNDRLIGSRGTTCESDLGDVRSGC